jgi:hypothetical protein
MWSLTMHRYGAHDSKRSHTRARRDFLAREALRQGKSIIDLPLSPGRPVAHQFHPMQQSEYTRVGLSAVGKTTSGNPLSLSLYRSHVLPIDMSNIRASDMLLHILGGDRPYGRTVTLDIHPRWRRAVRPPSTSVPGGDRPYGHPGYPHPVAMK